MATVKANRMVERTTEFVLAQLAKHRSNHAEKTACPPLFVGVQGPQGAGKSYLTSLLPDHLSTHHALRLAIMSLDDYYLTHADQVKLRETKSTNPLLSGRGPAGTHDLPLFSQSLDQLANINSEHAKPVQLATYDKSKYAGEGDRAEETVTVTGPIDVVIFEGWMNGFASLPAEQLRSRYDKAAEDSTIRSYPLQVLEEINRNLKEYEEKCWRRIDCFVQIEPVELSFVWTWREQQEHHMKSLNGGVGMSDDQVRAFINSYELFQHGIDDDNAPWHGKGLKFVVDIKREIVDVKTF